MGFLDTAAGVIGGGLFSKKFRKGASDLLFGTPEKREQVSNLTPTQMINQEELEQAGRGAYGTSADYYRNLLSNNSNDYNAFAAPELRQFREQIIPDLAEQFAGMGAGGLSSSGFRNAAVGAGTDLSERLGAIRAQLRQQGAQGLQNIGAQALTPHTSWQTTQPGTQGLLSQAAPAIAQTGISYASGGGGFSLPKFGSSSPYGNLQSI